MGLLETPVSIVDPYESYGGLNASHVCCEPDSGKLSDPIPVIFHGN